MDELELAQMLLGQSVARNARLVQELATAGKGTVELAWYKRECKSLSDGFERHNDEVHYLHSEISKLKAENEKLRGLDVVAP